VDHINQTTSHRDHNHRHGNIQKKLQYNKESYLQKYWRSISLRVSWCSCAQTHKASMPPLVQPPSDDDFHRIESLKMRGKLERRRRLITSRISHSSNSLWVRVADVILGIKDLRVTRRYAFTGSREREKLTRSWEIVEVSF